MMRAGVVLTVLCAAVLPRLAAAQGGDNPALCWEPRPAPACRHTLITEVGVATTLSNTATLYLTSEMGVMKTVGPRGAVGAALFLGMLDDDGRLGFKVRYRRWIGRDLVADAGAGPLLLNASYQAQHLGFVAHTGLAYRDWLGATLQFELVRYEPGRTTGRAFLGVRTGTYPGFGGNLLGGILVLFAVAINDPFDRT